MKAGEFGVAAIEIEHVDRFSGRRRLADHRHRIGGHQKGIGHREIGEIRVVAGAVPDRARQVRRGARCSSAIPSAPVRREASPSAEPPRSRKIAAIASAISRERAARSGDRPCCCRRSGPPRIGRGIAANSGKRPALGGEPCRGHAVHRTPRHHHPRSAKPVVLGHDEQVEFAAPDARVLDLRGDRGAAAGAPDRQRRHRRVAAAGDDEVGPGRASGGRRRRWAHRAALATVAAAASPGQPDRRGAFRQTQSRSPRPARAPGSPSPPCRHAVPRRAADASAEVGAGFAERKRDHRLLYGSRGKRGKAPAVARNKIARRASVFYDPQNRSGGIGCGGSSSTESTAGSCANLQADGRMTNVELAHRAGISAPPCLRRVRALEEAGYHPRLSCRSGARAAGLRR